MDPTDSGLDCQTRTLLVLCMSSVWGKSEREIHSSSSFPLENVSHSAQILPQNEELVHTKWPSIAAHRLWLVLFLRRPGGLWAGGLFGDGGDLGGFGPAAGPPRGVRGVGADGASVLQL